jgi:hypothetical protein
MKACSKCKVPKEEFNFRKDKSKKDGLRPDCKSCSSKLRLASIKSKIIETEEQKKVRLENKEKKRLYDIEYRKLNARRIKARGEDYYYEVIKVNEEIKNKMKDRSREYYYKNKESMNEYQREYKKRKRLERKQSSMLR